MVDCAGLENRRAERFRGFESHPLRQFVNRSAIELHFSENLTCLKSWGWHENPSVASYGFESHVSISELYLIRAAHPAWPERSGGNPTPVAPACRASQRITPYPKPGG